ncbi:lipopolysaccharide biosynthesis protein [Parasedimentitalea marina]|nr:lipopolysaccharide biosynthesis protein [Parasedimentitalea marina]
MIIPSRLMRVLESTFVRKFATQSLVAFSIKVGSSGLAFLMFVALASAMDQVSFGIFGTFFSLATFCAAVGSFGQRANVIRFAAGYDQLGQDHLRRGVTVFGYRLVLFGTVVAGIGGTLFAFLFLDISGANLLWLGVPVMVLGIGLTEFQSRALRTNAGVALVLLPRGVFWRVFIIVVTAVAISLFGRAQDTYSTWVWIIGISLLVTALLQWLAYEGKHPDKSFRGPMEMETAIWKRELAGPWTSLVVVSATTNLAVFMVGALLSFEQAGPFFAALRLTQLLNLLMLATEVILNPMISRAIASKRWGQVQRACTLTAVLGGGFALIGIIGYFLAGKFLLNLFSPEFTSAYTTLLILAVGFVVNTLAGPTSPLLQMSGHAAALARFQLIANVGSLCCMPLFIPLFGIEGAAVCITGSMITWNVQAWLYARKKLKIDPTIISLLNAPKGKSSQG